MIHARTHTRAHARTHTHTHIHTHTHTQLADGGVPLSEALAPALRELARLPKQAAPRDILHCLLASSRQVTRTLLAAGGEGGRLPGADEVLPALILAIKEANPRGLCTALEVVQRYRHPAKLHVSEAAYVFTNVASAVHFLETVGGMDDGEVVD